MTGADDVTVLHTLICEDMQMHPNKLEYRVNSSYSPLFQKYRTYREIFYCFLLTLMIMAYG